MMHLFRRRFGARDQTPTNNTEEIDNNPPPSYEDSQDASLREVLHGARAILPLLWPSTSDSPSSSSPPTATFAPSPSPSPSKLATKYESMAADRKSEKYKSKWESEDPSPYPQEDAIIEVLANLAMAPCNGRPFLDRVRQFSDFYLRPYMASEGDPSDSRQSQNDDTNSAENTEKGQPIPIPAQEHQRKILASISAPRESTALVLCARVLEDYYSKLGHIDSAAEVNTPLTPSSSPSSSPSTTTPYTKTQITQIAACLAERCVCSDFDQANANSIPLPTQTQEFNNPNPDASPSPHCSCGHPRTSHSPSTETTGLSRLMRLYTNWDNAPYATLTHRSPDGAPKRRIGEIRACGADCPCQDYDKGRRTGRCARCGHYDGDHFPVNVAREKKKKQQHQKQPQPQKDKRWKRKGGGSATSNTTGTDSAQEGAEWELSWILIENAYQLLNQIAPLSQDENC
ncbi:hypothetical protein F5Y09DRAFT_160120 [Xylaria sp. FL1042]|nr:hypothetical protein F5Y09DRAFT_160120 [Xylaria sp. FL1042]